MDYESFITLNLFPKNPSSRPAAASLPGTVQLGPFGLNQAMRACWLLKDIFLKVDWSYGITVSGKSETFSGTASFIRADYDPRANYASLEPFKRLCSAGGVYAGMLGGYPLLRIGAPFFWEEYGSAIPMDERSYGFECFLSAAMPSSRNDLPFALTLLLRPPGDTGVDSYTLVHSQPAQVLGKDMLLCLYIPQNVADPESGYNFSASASIAYFEEYFGE